MLEGRLSIRGPTVPAVFCSLQKHHPRRTLRRIHPNRATGDLDSVGDVLHQPTRRQYRQRHTLLVGRLFASNANVWGSSS